MLKIKLQSIENRILNKLTLSKIQMKEHRKGTNSVLKFIFQIFTSATVIPPFFQYFVTLVEFFVFTIFVSSNTSIDPIVFPSVIQRNVILFLVGLLILRSVTKITLIKSIYPLFIIWNIQSQFNILSVVVYALLLTHIVIDVVSKIEFSFETKNLHSSTYPWFIALHYFIIVSLIAIRYFNFSKGFIFPLCQILAFGVLILIQFRAIMKHQEFKNLQIRFYFLSCFYAITQLYQVFVSQQPLWKNVFAIITSQLLYEFIQWKTLSDFNVEEFISKNMEIQAGYYIFSFLYTKKPLNKEILKALKILSNEDTKSLVQEKNLKEQMMNTKRGIGNQFSALQSNEIRQVGNKLLILLKEHSSVYAQLFLAELALYQMEQHVKCRQILYALKKRSSCMNIFTRILIKKIEKKLFDHMRIEHDKCKTPNFYEFIQNEKFRNLLLKSSLNFIDLWEYTKVKEGIYKKIKQLAQNVIKSIHKIRTSYQELPVKCIRMNVLYGSYLFYVERDNDLANKIMQSLYFYQEKEENLECDNKIFIKIAIHTKQPLRISAIGSNVNKHLGYERRLLAGMNINEMLPDFYKESHETRVAQVFENQTQRLFLFNKSTIVKHLKGRYVTALLCLRLTYDQEGELFMQGYMKINTDEKHNWHNYLFVKNATKQIIQCSSLVNQKISQIKGKKFNAGEYFDECEKDFQIKIQKYTSDINKYFYQPVMSFGVEDDEVTMFVELDPYAKTVEQRLENVREDSKRQILIPEMTVYPKYKVVNNIKHFLRKKVSTKESLESIKIKILILISVIFLMVIGIYILEEFQIQSLNKEYESKVKTIILTQNIMRHYMGLGKIGIDLSYLVVNQNYGYNLPGFPLKLKENIMTVQETNQYFKKYSISEWQYKSVSSVQQNRSGYEFISQILGAASFLDLFPSDTELRKNLISSFNELFTDTFVLSYSEYTDRVQEQLVAKGQNKDINQIVNIVVLVFLCSLLFVFIIKLQSYSRVSQHETLQFIGSISIQDQIIDKTKDFIQLITEEKIESLSNNKNLTNAILSMNIGEGVRLSQLSARQNTGRELIGNMSGRDTIRSDINVDEKNTQKVQTQDFSLKMRPVNKLFILLPFFFIIALIGLQVFNYVLNVKMRQINEVQSLRNIVESMNKPLFFTRLVNAFLTEDRGPKFTDHDETFYKVYKLFENSYNSVASFDEINHQQFSEFQQKLRKIRFDYLCTYAECPAIDKDYVNILYTTTMQKLANYMLNNKYFLNDPNHKIKTILMSEQLFRQIMVDMIQTYIKNYNQYATNFKKNQMLFIIIIICVLSILLFSLFLQIYYKVFKSICKHLRICDIVKESSYLINKESLISFEQQQLQKQKIQQKKKQIKKTSKDKQNASELSQNFSKIIQDKLEKRTSKSPVKTKLKVEQAEKKQSIFKELQMNSKR